jgi:AcrR family transcriptional regulator
MARKPQQARSILSMARMLDAAEALFAEGGVEALTVEAVVERSNTSVGSFYARFGERDGLLEAMHERFLERLAAGGQIAIQAAARQKKLVSALEVLITHIFAIVREYRNSARFFVMHRSTDVKLRTQGIQANAFFARMFADLVLRYQNEIAHANPANAADVAWRMTFAMFAQQVMFENQEVSGLAIGDKALARELARCLTAYLTSATSGTAFADRRRQNGLCQSPQAAR